MNEASQNSTTYPEMEQLIRATPLEPCPSWCRLPSEHGWDGYDGTLLHRGHAGPVFGHISVGGNETNDGRMVLDSCADINDDLTPAQWRDVARDADKAADWLEATAASSTCPKSVVALTADEQREMRPCVRETGHDGVCRYATGATR